MNSKNDTRIEVVYFLFLRSSEEIRLRHETKSEDIRQELQVYYMPDRILDHENNLE
jgi:hypothetical protein